MEGVAEQLLRFAHYALLFGLFGWSAFRVIGLRKLGWLNMRGLPRGVALAAVAAPIISAALMLVSIAAMMGQPVSALDPAMTEAMIFGTTMGNTFLIRIALLAAGLAALIATGNRDHGLSIAASCFAGALCTLGWSGHAAATEAGLGLFHRLNNGLHLMAAGLWLGAIGWFLNLTIQCQRDGDPSRARDLLGVMHGFAPLGVGLVGLVALTGAINASLIVGLLNVVSALGTPYGHLLAVKTALVAAMLVFGALNAGASRAFGQKKRVTGTDAAPSIAALRRSLACELLLGVLVTGVVAVIGTQSPAMI